MDMRRRRDPPVPLWSLRRACCWALVSSCAISCLTDDDPGIRPAAVLSSRHITPSEADEMVRTRAVMARYGAAGAASAAVAPTLQMTACRPAIRRALAAAAATSKLIRLFEIAQTVLSVRQSGVISQDTLRDILTVVRIFGGWAAFLAFIGVVFGPDQH